MFFRRLRYMISGKIIRIFFSILSISVVLAIVGAFLFGFINQKNAFDFAFNKITKIGFYISDTINNTADGDSNLKLTDQGIYIDGYEPENSEEIESENAFSGFKEDYVGEISDEIESRDNPE